MKPSAAEPGAIRSNPELDSVGDGPLTRVHSQEQPVVTALVVLAASLRCVDDALITRKDAAAILSVSWQRVQQLATEGKLGPIAAEGVGRTRILYRRADVERLRA
jgi:hypothetical protein